MNLEPFFQIVKTKLPGERHIYKAHMPNNVKRGVLILHPLGGAGIDPNLPKYRKTRFQAIIRDTSFQSGYDLAKQVSDALEVARVTVGTVYIHFVRPLHDPVGFPQSGGGFIEFSVNFETAYVDH